MDKFVIADSAVFPVQSKLSGLHEIRGL